MAANTEPTLSVTVERLHAEPLASAGLRAVLASWWVAFAGSALFVVSGHLLIKAGLNGAASSPAHGSLLAFLQPALIAGLLIYGLGTVCWMRAVSQKEISFLYPLSSINYVLVALASSFWFHEVISLRRALGIIVIVFGMILINRESKETA